MSFPYIRWHQSIIVNDYVSRFSIPINQAASPWSSLQRLRPAGRCAACASGCSLCVDIVASVDSRTCRRRHVWPPGFGGVAGTSEHQNDQPYSTIPVDYQNNLKYSDWELTNGNISSPKKICSANPSVAGSGHGSAREPRYAGTPDQLWELAMEGSSFIN